MNVLFIVVCKLFGCLLLMGVVGNFGCQLCGVFVDWVDVVCVSDIVVLDDVVVYEEICVVDLVDWLVVMQFVDGVDVIIYFGGILVDVLFDDLVGVNIIGMYNLYEVVCKYGVKCVVFVSLNYVIGFYLVMEVFDVDVLLCFDSLYGVMKCFGELLLWYYFDCFGIEIVCLWIGLLFEVLKNLWMFVIFFSYCDFIEFVCCLLLMNCVGYVIVYGVLDNLVKWWDNMKVGFFGFCLCDSFEQFIGLFLVMVFIVEYDDFVQWFQGGGFVVGELMEWKVL